MKHILFVIILAVLLLTCLFFYYENRQVYKENDAFRVTYNMLHEPKKNAYGQYFFVDGIMVTIPLYPTYSYGDVLDISGRVEKKTTTKGQMLVVANPTITKKESNLLLSVGRFFRQRVSNVVLTTLPSREGGLLLGILLGVRDKINNDFYQELKSAGVLHVIAASGQNVSIVAGVLYAVFLRLVKRRGAILFTVLGILFYAFLTGFDPPIVRAALMAIIAFGAMIFGRQASSLYALLITACVMALASPELLEDISFQLSFMSTFGILTVKPILDRGADLKLLQFIKDDITTTLSAQIATLPLMLTAFGSYFLLSFPANIAVLWTVPFIMIFGGIGAILSILSPILAIPWVYLTLPFLAFFVNIIHFFAKFPYSITFETQNLYILMGYYILLGAVVMKFQKK